MMFRYVDEGKLPSLGWSHTLTAGAGVFDPLRAGGGLGCCRAPAQLSSTAARGRCRCSCSGVAPAPAVVRLPTADLPVRSADGVTSVPTGTLEPKEIC